MFLAFLLALLLVTPAFAQAPQLSLEDQLDQAHADAGQCKVQAAQLNYTLRMTRKELDGLKAKLAELEKKDKKDAPAAKPESKGK